MFCRHVVATLHRLPPRSYLSYKIPVYSFGATVSRYDAACVDSDNVITHRELGILSYALWERHNKRQDCSANSFIHLGADVWLRYDAQVMRILWRER